MSFFLYGSSNTYVCLNQCNSMGNYASTDSEVVRGS